MPPIAASGKAEVDTEASPFHQGRMSAAHPLDRPAHAALFSRQAGLSSGGDLARRLRAEYGPFAAARDDSDEALAALCALNPAEGGLALIEPEGARLPKALPVVSQAPCAQMLLGEFHPRPIRETIAVLGPEDASEMQALAALTRPGPFSTRTHELGRFLGVRREGRLIAMAGERMQPTGFTEVSGVCTHPDFQGMGLAGQLMSAVIANILDKGERAFLHAYTHNRSAIGLYESLGFAQRAVVVLTLSGPQPSGSSTR
jgi:predicted GNAT family acetyltransferase